VINRDKHAEGSLSDADPPCLLPNLLQVGDSALVFNGLGHTLDFMRRLLDCERNEKCGLIRAS
jgi:hypothetical protein